MRHLYNRYPLKTAVYDVRGIWPFSKLCEFVGTWLARNKRWAVLIATGFGALDLGVDASTGAAQGLQSLTMTGGIMGTYLVVAYGLKFGPTVLQGQKRGMAEAVNLNLMEDYRKRNELAYLERMWDEIFQYALFRDYAKLYRRKRDKAGRELEEATGLERLAAAQGEERRRLFIALAQELLYSSEPQAEQERHLGTGLEMLEDLFDSGPFTWSDRKLEQNYDGHPRILAARALVGYGLIDKGHELVKRKMADLWFHFLRSSVAVHVGNAVNELNEYYDNAINAQRLLWPGTEELPLAGLDWDRAVAAEQTIRLYQKGIMRHRLGADWDTAQRKLGRAFTPMFELATTLRARFDPAYVLGEVGDVLKDLRDDGHVSDDTPFTDGFFVYRQSTREHMERFDAWLEESGPFIATREQVRAVRIAFHVNYEKMRDAFYAAGATELMEYPPFRRSFCGVVAKPHPWTQMLIDVQMLHTLSRVRREEYEALVHRLGAYDEV